MVDSISPDLREVQKSPKISRRQLLGILGGSLVAFVAKKAGLFEGKSQVEGQSQAQTPTLPPNTPTSQPTTPQSTPEPQPQAYEEAPIIPRSFIEKKDSREVVCELLFPSFKYLAKEADNGMAMVDEQIEVYRKIYKDKAVGPKEIALKVHRLEPVVKDAADLVKNDAKNLFMGDEMRQKQFQEALSFAAKLLPGLIFAESQGDPKRISSSGAIGLCQLMPKTIREYAALLKITVSSKEEDFKKRFSEETMNIYLGLIHLARMLTLFPDPGLALWAYHLGEGEMGEKVVELYIRSVIQKTVKDEKTQKEKIERIDKVLRDKNEIGTAVLASEYGINFIRVVNAEFITAQFQGKEHDSTLAYVKNVGAGLFFLNEYPKT